MAINKESGKQETKGHSVMKTPAVVSQQEWEAARQ